MIRATALVVAKVCKIQKVLNFAHFNNNKNTHISACKSVQIYKTATVTVHICMVIVHVQMIFLFFFLFLPLYFALLLYLFLTTKPHNHLCPSLNHWSLSSSNNKITKPPLPSLNHRSRWYHPNTKTQKLKLAITHHNTKTQKLKLAITHHRTIKNQMKSNSKINQNSDEVKWGPW